MSLGAAAWEFLGDLLHGRVSAGDPRLWLWAGAIGGGVLLVISIMLLVARWRLRDGADQRLAE